ncbi:hypothetical protein DUI87_21060 [Hirundo rustica rustica]|uniref:Uncharacterized protein n=1 Tax=Hirundo rustica rustica TaxID=333673 RepID=A0A3M0JM07_HIRRU|nr:hypothetical protein DUI87_21060 [Hirundo rustica rustica]
MDRDKDRDNDRDKDRDSQSPPGEALGRSCANNGPEMMDFTLGNSPREPGQPMPHRLAVLALSDPGNSSGKGGKGYPWFGPRSIVISRTFVSRRRSRTMECNQEIRFSCYP